MATGEYLDKFISDFRKPLGSKIHVSEWTGDLDECKAIAEQRGIPMLAIWCYHACSCCNDLERTLMSQKFNEWRSKSCDFLLCFTCSRDPKGIYKKLTFGHTKGEYYTFCSGNGKVSYWPMVRLYWPDKNIDISTTTQGSDLVSGSKDSDFEKKAPKFIDWLMSSKHFGSFALAKKDEDLRPSNDQNEFTEHAGDFDFIDNSTMSNFKTGVWYGNIAKGNGRNDISDSPQQLQALLQQAGNASAPVIIVWGALNCERCTIYYTNVLKNISFSQWMKSSGCYFYYVYDSTGWGSSQPETQICGWLTKTMFNGKSFDTPHTSVWWNGTLKGGSPFGYCDLNTALANIQSRISGFVPHTDVFTVKFMSYDNVEISRQEVQYGANATQPIAPQRNGYTFIGFKPSGQNVQSNLVCVAQYQANAQPPTPDPKPQKTDPQFTISYDATGKTYVLDESRFPLHSSYDSTGYKRMLMSNNVSAFCARGDSYDSAHSDGRNGIEDQLISAVVDSNVETLMPSCFMDCTNLLGVAGGDNIQRISDYAFYNCQQLTSVPMLESKNNMLMNIGDFAFANSGVKQLKINLKSSVSDSSMNEYCFANCKKLQKVDIVGAPYLAGHMFDGCTSLSSISMKNAHSYVFEYCFANCTSLQEFNAPANLYMLSPHMFDGCTNLRSITFSDDSILKNIEDSVFANCPNLTSITLPESVNDLKLINPQFLAKSNIQRIVFKGIHDEEFGRKRFGPVSINFSFDKWYSPENDGTDLNALIACAKENHIPVVWAVGLPGCGQCKATAYFEDIPTGKTRTMMKDDCKYCYKKYKGKPQNLMKCDVPTCFSHGSGSLNQNVKDDFLGKGYLFIFGSSSGRINCVKFGKCHDYWESSSYSAVKSTFAQDRTGNARGGLYWLKEDGTEKRAEFGQDENSTKVRKKLAETFEGYEPKSEATYEIKDELTTFGKGPGQSVVYVSAEGNEYVCTNDQVKMKPQYRVDKSTTSNFKVGIWYYNAIQLKAFADQHHLPVLVEWSSAGCEPCVDFRVNTWENENFQNEVVKRKCLLCRIECEPKDAWDDNSEGSQEYFVSHNWGDPKVLIPQLVFYWNKGNDNIYREVWNYNYRTDPANANYQTVLNKLDKMLQGYSSSGEYNAPTIYSSENGKFRFYQNIAGDDDCSMFICDKKTDITSYQGTLSIDIHDGSTGLDVDESTAANDGDDVTILTSLALGEEVEIPKTSYQYFTTDDDSVFYDLSGVIFKIDDQAYYNGKRMYLGVDGKMWDSEHTVSCNTSDISTNKREVTRLMKFQNDMHKNEYDQDEQYSKYQPGQMNSCTDSTATNGFNDIIAQSTAKSQLVVIFESTSNQQFNSSLWSKNEWKRWMIRSSYLFIDITSAEWNQNAPAAMRQFEQEVQFHDNAIGSNLPKILVFHGCMNCGEGKYGAIFCRRAIVFDASKDVSYYTSLIDSYAQLVDD